MYFTGEWVNKLWHICTMEYYSVIKINDLTSHKRHGGNLNAYCWVKEASLKRLLTAKLNLHSHSFLIPMNFYSTKERP